MILDQQGRLWGKGKNTYGQLGPNLINDEVEKFQQIEWPFDDSVKNFSCGYHHTIVLSNSGRVYGIGGNIHGTYIYVGKI